MTGKLPLFSKETIQAMLNLCLTVYVLSIWIKIISRLNGLSSFDKLKINLLSFLVICWFNENSKKIRKTFHE